MKTNSPQHHPSPVKFVVTWIGLIVLTCIAGGTFLLATGYQSGELLVGIAGSGLGALGGMIAARSMNTPTTASGAIATEVTNTPSKPVNVQNSEQ